VIARQPLPPAAVVVTVYDDLSGARALPLLDRLARSAAPDDLAVAIHDPPGLDEERLAVAIKARGWRLWYAWGVDPDAKRPVRDAAAITRRRARLAADRGAEAVELNGESAWKAPDLDDHATAILEACRDGAPGLPVGWSTFDGPITHRLPASRTIFGGAHLAVDFSAPQVYCASAQTPGDHAAALRRWERAQRQHQALSARGDLRPELIPGEPRCLPYAQIHGCTPACVAWILDRADLSRAWALPTRSDSAGVLGLEALLRARRDHGRSAGAIARAQAALGLTPDGIAGPRTLEALGLTPT
jgi:hypothetical protein